MAESSPLQSVDEHQLLQVCSKKKKLPKYSDIHDRQRSRTHLSPPRSRSAPDPHPRPSPHLHLHPPPPLPLNPHPQKLLPAKTTPGKQPILPKSPNGAPYPPPHVPKPNSPVPNGKSFAPVKKRNVKPSVNHLNLWMTSARISLPLLRLPAKSSPTPSLRPLRHLARPNTSSRTDNQKRPRNARYSMARQRMARPLSHGNTSRPHQRLRTLPCPSLKLPYHNHPLPKLLFSRHLPHLSQPRLIHILKQAKTRHISLLPPFPPSWTTRLHHGHDCHSYYPPLLLTCYSPSLMASCLVLGRSLQKMSWLGGLVGKRGVEVQLPVLGFGGDGVIYNKGVDCTRALHSILSQNVRPSP